MGAQTDDDRDHDRSDLPITLADPGIGDQERAVVDRVMRSGWISMGKETEAFETELAGALDAAGAVAVNSGTAALHLAALALGLGPGDEVVVPSLTFVATAAAALMVGARPVFVDVAGPDDLTLDPAAVSAALTTRTRAIVAVHYGGWPAQIGQLRAIADAAGVALVEDAAHAPLVRCPEGMLGTIGDVGCFSFHAAKNITTGEGGMVVSQDPELLDRVRRLRSHGMATPTTQQGKRERMPGYDVAEVGFNYRPTDLAAAIGRVQLARFDREQESRRALTAEYCRLLSGSPVTLPFALPDNSTPSAHHLLPVLLPTEVDRDRLQADLREGGVHTSVHYPPVHLFSLYRELAAADGRTDGPASLPWTEQLAPRLLSLPLHGRMDPGDVGRVVAALEGALAVQRVDPVPAGPGQRRYEVSGGR
jgi:dTDP-4-amino-4,6-dideoxygalactose transaminase